jgi:hypothetical protein
MISVFDVFKIILGVIISAFILFVALRFVGSYIQVGESGREASSIINFKNTMEKVYTTGISADFDFKDSKTILGYRPPYIETPIAFVDTSPIPVILVPGEKLSVHRVEYDTGWWKFYFIAVVPETGIIFVPLGQSEREWSVVGNVSSMLPSTENTNTKLRFGLGCNGTDWFGLWEGNKFLKTILPGLAASDIILNRCENTEYFREKNFRIITISDNTENAENADFTVSPVEGDVGYVYVRNGEEYEKYMYKNGLDIVALMLGGEKLYNYTNGKFLKELEVAIDVSSDEYSLLPTDEILNSRCQSAGMEFLGTLSSIKNLIPKLKSGASESDLIEFARYMRISSAKYKELESRGCT